MSILIKTNSHKGHRIDIIDYGHVGLAHNITNLNLKGGHSPGAPNCCPYTTEEEKQRLVEELIQKAKDEIDAKLLK